MATKTSFLGLSKPDYTDVADIAVLNGNFDLIDKAAGNGRFVRNELDNSFFPKAFVINQRGVTSQVGGGYCIDRWKAEGTGTIAVGSGGITLTDALSFLQPVSLTAGTYTLAFHLTNGTTLRNCFKYDGASTITTVNSQGWETAGAYIGCYHHATGVVAVQFVQGAGYEYTLEWAALYKGEYTAETLPTYVYKGYAAEWDECRRYYRVDLAVCTVGTQYGTETKGVISIVISGMRAQKSTPTVTSIIGQGWGNIRPEHLTAGWSTTAAGLCYTNFLVETGSTSVIGQTILIKYEATGDL